MTGPGEGKIPLDAKVYLSWRRVECDVYLHVRGYSLARVTHLDVESGVLNEAIPPRASTYATAYTAAGSLRLRFREPLKFSFGPVRELVIECSVLCEALGAMRDVVFVGGKEGGIFLGFRREQIGKLEELAARAGVPPRRSARVKVE